MKPFNIVKKAAAAIALMGGILACASSSFAQGCALCYADAAAAGPQTQAALRHGILILMIPPLFLFAGFYSLLYRRTKVHRNAFEDDPAVHASPGNSSEFVLHLN